MALRYVVTMMSSLVLLHRNTFVVEFLPLRTKSGFSNYCSCSSKMDFKRLV